METRVAENYEVVSLDGVKYAVVRESVFRELCRRAKVESAGRRTADAHQATELAELDRESLTRRLTDRRKRAGLSQAELARRAGIRAETLNRVERGRTTPDFSTIRKLVIAMNEAECAADCGPPTRS